jgi:hypothetical protein
MVPVAGAIARDATDAGGRDVITIAVGDGGSPAEIRQRIRQLIDDGQRVVLSGRPGDLALVRPDFAHAWPVTNTIVLDPGISLGVSGFDAVDEDARNRMLRRWIWSDELFSDGTGPRRRGAGVPAGTRRRVEFSMLATSPAAACRNFTHKMAEALFGQVAPTTSSRRAFRKEARRWCQYGNLSVHAAEGPQYVIEPFRGDDNIVLNLVSEWALMRNEDSADPAATTYVFWTRTMGEGAGTGFSRRSGTDAWYDPGSLAIRDMLDAAIHSGWGPIEPPAVATAWPLNSTFPATGNVHLFRCDGPNAFRPYDCPFAPMLRKLFPDDSHGGSVTVSTGESISVGGDISVTRTFSSDAASIDMTFGVNLLRTVASNVQVALSLADTRSNGDSQYYRSTWWRPDIPAIQSWIDARRHAGSLARATPLAATLNPRHEIVWELPLQRNAGRELPYHVVYEAGWNTCVHGNHCKDYRRYPAPNLPTKARVGWSDGIVLRLPSR